MFNSKSEAILDRYRHHHSIIRLAFIDLKQPFLVKIDFYLSLSLVDCCFMKSHWVLDLLNYSKVIAAEHTRHIVHI